MWVASMLRPGFQNADFLWGKPEFLCDEFLDKTTGWWFGTFFMFPNTWDDDPI
jgi:hypothetical protein